MVMSYRVFPRIPGTEDNPSRSADRLLVIASFLDRAGRCRNRSKHAVAILPLTDNSADGITSSLGRTIDVRAYWDLGMPQSKLCELERQDRIGQRLIDATPARESMVPREARCRSHDPTS